MKKILIADMCFHQIMAESMYLLFSNIGDTYIFTNESRMNWTSNIPSHKIIYNTLLFGKENIITRRLNRIAFLCRLIMARNKYDLILFTSGIEFAPKLTRTIWYTLFLILCKSKKANVAETIHSIKFWKSIKGFGLKKYLLRNILRSLSFQVCLSEFVLSEWLKTGLTNRPSVRIPFQLVTRGQIANVQFPASYDPIVIGILGTVSHRRREYSDLIECVKLLEDDKKKHLKLFFQGPPVEQVDKLFLQELSRRITVEYREYYLPTDEMYDKLSQCHIFVAPLNRNYGYGVYRESGAGFDSIKYQRGVIVPKGMLSCEFKTIAVEYEDASQLANILTKMDVELINKINQSVIEIGEKFTPDFLLTEIKEFLKRLHTNELFKKSISDDSVL